MASTRFRSPELISLSTEALQFSTPASARSCGVPSPTIRPRPASTRIVADVPGSTRSVRRHDRMRRLKFVDHGMEVDACSVEETDHSRVDVPDLVRLRGAGTQGGHRGMDPKTRPAPTSLPDQTMPGRRRREDAAESLREHGELAGRYVPERRGRDHASDRGDLLWRQPLRRGVETGRGVLELARLGGASPRAEAEGRKSEKAKDTCQTEHTPRAGDGSEEPGLVGGSGNAQPRQVRLQGLEEREEDAEHGLDSPEPTLQPHDTHAELGAVGIRRPGRDDGPCFAPHPHRRRGTRDPVPRGEVDVSGLADESNEAVVVGTLPAAGRHRAIVTAPPTRRNCARTDRLRCGVGNSHR